MEDKFKFWKKWFWVGILIGSLNLLAGLIYAVALIMEPEHRKEGLAILGWSVVVFAVLIYTLGPALRAQ